MQLSIQTDSRILSSKLTSLIEKARRIEPSTTGYNKYFFFKCKHDLIEALYWCACVGSDTSVGVWTTQASESISGDTEHIIATGETFRKKKYETTFYFDDNLFIHND